MRCDQCKHWTPNPMYPKERGKCNEIKFKIDIEVDAGWDGGMVGEIETPPDFFCAGFERKEG